MKHTPEPWEWWGRHFARDPQNHWRINEAATGNALAMVLGVADNLKPGQQEANARRIVAAINACAGIPTEALEADVVRRVWEALERLVRVIDAAGSLNLSDGVQLGQTAWYVKCEDALQYARVLLREIDGDSE